MGDGTRENPYTREDVLRLIAENGGNAQYLNLSGKYFEKGIDLRRLNLRGIILSDAHLERAHLREATLERAHLEDAHLERAHLQYAYLEGADLEGAHLEGADLEGAHLEGADLLHAYLEGAHLWDAKFTADTKLEAVDWGNYVLGEEKRGEFNSAADTYRRLKRWYTTAGIYDMAGKFFYREQEANRQYIQQEILHQLKKAKCKKFFHFILKSFVRKPRQGWNLVWFWIYRILCGYGERPQNVIAWAASVIVISTLVYFTIGSVWEVWQSSTFWNSLYFSAVSFTALGYGSWVKLGNNLASDIIRGIGAFESFIGVFTIALFLITFIRKMTR